MLLAIWSTWLDAPDGPSTPFGSPVLIVLDVIRVLTMLISGYALVRCFRALFHYEEPHQRARFLALGLILLNVCGTEFEHLGDYAHYRLGFNFLASMLSIY